MRLLVSVRDATEAAAALAGGADIIDAKDPFAGALGAVTTDVLTAIHSTVAGACLVTAALGDAGEEATIAHTARTFASAGARLVKIGFAGTTSARRVASLLTAAVHGVKTRTTSETGVVAVAYADADRVGSIRPFALIEGAARAGAVGVLLDTAHKTGPGLRGLVAPGALADWVFEGHQMGLIVALAGQVTADDLDFVRDSGADIVGVRGAVCDDGRTSSVAAAKVRALKALCAGVTACLDS